MIEKFKKILCLMVFSILLSFFCVPNINAETAKVSTAGIGAYYHAYKNSNGTFSRYGQLQSFYVTNGTYQKQRVYCIAPGEIWYSSKNYDIVENTEEAINKINSTQNNAKNKLTQEQIDKMSYYAYYGHGYGNHTSNVYIVATQMLIYRVMEAQVFTNVNCTNGSCSKISDPTAVVNAMEEIQALVDRHFVRPSFNNTEIKLAVGETITLTDNNNILSDYTIKSCNNCSATINGNNLNVTATGNGNIKVSLEKGGNVYDNDVMFLASSESQNMIMRGNVDPLNATVYGSAFTGTFELYKTNENGTIKLSGAEYNLYNSSNQVVCNISTNTSGYYKCDNLELGTYTLKEVSAPTGYNLDSETYTITITEDNSKVTLTLTDKIIEGYVDVYKVDSETNQKDSQGEATLIGAKYDIFTSNGEYVETLTINSDNYAKSSKLKYGNYYIVESTAPEGYKLNATRYDFTINEENKTITITLKDEVIKAPIKITKYDSKTNSCVAQGDATLVGAIYEIYNYNDEIVDSVTIGSDCTGTSKPLPYGVYNIKEKTPSKGYHLDETIYTATINSETTINVTSKEKAIEVKVELYKVEANGNTAILKAEPNVNFEFYLKSNNELYISGTTNSKGYLEVFLPYGTYIVKQTTATYNFEKVDDFEIVATDENEETITKIISNAEVTAKLKLIKTDLESGKTILKKGIKFMIKNLDINEYVCQNITYPTPTKLCIYETDKNGEFVTPYALSSGNYQVEEIEEQNLNGYLWNNTPLKFSITQDSDFKVDKDYGIILEVKFSNIQVKGEFELEKIGEIVNFDNNTITYDNKKLDNVSFKLIANEDIYSQDGTLIYKNKDEVTSFKTNKGYHKESDLYLGKYCLIETATSDEYVLNTKPYCFELKYKDQYTDVVKLDIELKNYLKKSDFKLTKTDISTGNPVAGALIEIYNLKDQLVFSDRTDSNGNITIKSLPYGSYKFIESDAPEGYVLNDEVHYFEVKENGEIIKDTITNKKIIGSLEFTKTDFSESETLPNTVIEIYNINDELIYTGKTDENGKIIISELEYGEYYILEKEAPSNYLLNTEKMYFKITKDGEIVKATMKDEQIIDVPKTGKNDIPYIDIISGICIITGLGFILLKKERKRKK